MDESDRRLFAELILATDQSDEEVEAEVRGWLGYSCKDYWREIQIKAAKGIEVQIDPKNPFG